jgi:predicted flap endonuclease-1-like 5' DNA nuclease
LDLQDESFVLCTYVHQNRAQHPVVGPTGFEYKMEGLTMVRQRDGWHIHYGFRGRGDTFLVHQNDVQIAQSWFEPLEGREALIEEAPESLPEPTPIEVELGGPEVTIDVKQEPVIIDLEEVPEAMKGKLNLQDGISEEEFELAQEAIKAYEEYKEDPSVARPYEEFRDGLVAEGKLDAQPDWRTYYDKATREQAKKPAMTVVDLGALPGIGPVTAKKLEEKGWLTAHGLMIAAESGELIAIDGISDYKQGMIVDYLKERYEV